MAMLSEKLNNVFADALKNLNLPRYEHPSVNTDHIEDPITNPQENVRIIKAFLSNGGFLNNSTFSFYEIATSDIEITISDVRQLCNQLDHANFVSEW